MSFLLGGFVKDKAVLKMMSDYIKVTQRPILSATSLIQTNWYHIVIVPKLAPDMKDFTDMVMKWPQNKE